MLILRYSFLSPLLSCIPWTIILRYYLPLSYRRLHHTVWKSHCLFCFYNFLCQTSFVTVLECLGSMCCQHTNNRLLSQIHFYILTRKMPSNLIGSGIDANVTRISESCFLTIKNNQLLIFIRRHLARLVSYQLYVLSRAATYGFNINGQLPWSRGLRVRSSMS